MKENKLQEWELAQMQSLPLLAKESMSYQRIKDFYEEFHGNVYVSFSGGKDSTVLLDVARKYDSGILGVFVDTWMEYPQIRQHVKSFDNVVILKPDKSMKQIIDECGWCFPSKDVADMIDGVRNDKEWAIRKINGLDGDGNYSEFRQQYKKWKVLVDAPFKISQNCCIEMKEKVMGRFERESGLHPMTALMADESARRKEAYLRTGCNSFDSARPNSKPMGFWTEQDVLRYILQNSLPIASVYGEILPMGEMVGQKSLYSQYDICSHCKLCTSGESRTGCMFCPVGCHLDGFGKYKRLKKYDIRLYEYCMDALGLREVLIWIQNHVNVKGCFE